MKTHRAPSDIRLARLAAVLVVALVLFVLLLPVGAWLAAGDDDGSHCPGYGDAVTCLPYSHSHHHGGGTTNHGGSSARRPAPQPRPKAPGVKVPAAPPRLSLRK